MPRIRHLKKKLTNFLWIILQVPLPTYFGLPPHVWNHGVWYLGIVVAALCLISLSSAMFVAQMALFAKVSDPRIGGKWALFSFLIFSFSTFGVDIFVDLCLHFLSIFFFFCMQVHT